MKGAAVDKATNPGRRFLFFSWLRRSFLRASRANFAAAPLLRPARQNRHATQAKKYVSRKPWSGVRHSNKAATGGVRNWIGRTGVKTATSSFLFNQSCILIGNPVLENPVQRLILLLTLLLKPAPISSPSYHALGRRT